MRYINNETLEYMINSGEHWIRKDYAEYLEHKPVTQMPLQIGHSNYKIGIIIPNRNYAEWISKCLDSIRNQIYKNYEVIFVDDMSTDNSAEIAKEYQRTGMPIKIIELKQRRLNGGARNEGYLHLSNDVDYVWYVDSDDWLSDNDVLGKINAHLVGKPDVLFVGLGADYNGIMRSYYTPNYRDKYEAMLGWSGSSGKVIKKELATKQECLYQEGTLKEDRTQHYKICIEMQSFRCLNEIVYVWNKNNTKSTSTERNKKWKADTIRNWADSIDVFNTYKGMDIKLDQILQQRVDNCKNEVMINEDSQQ